MPGAVLTLTLTEYVPFPFPTIILGTMGSCCTAQHDKVTSYQDTTYLCG